LLRLGDILQTTPMLRALRTVEPETEITLVLRDQFQSVPIPAILYDRLVTFPWDAVSVGLRDSPSSWPKQVERVKAFLTSLGREPFDLLLNFSHSPAASYLCRLIPHQQARGLVMADDRTQINHSPWLTYFCASIGGRSKGAFNLVDLHIWSAGLPALASRPEIEVGAEARTRMGEWLAAHRLGERPIVAVQLGASEAKRMYPAETMAAVLNRVPATEADIVFVGVGSERPLAEATLRRLERPACSAVGETSVRELAALLERCRLLLTVDTEEEFDWMTVTPAMALCLFIAVVGVLVPGVVPGYFLELAHKAHFF
jgi:ADP-heptose:LPS heptosyltransferase